MTGRLQTRTAIAIAALALIAVLGGQALADRAEPMSANGAVTGAALGRAGFAYLTGLRKFGAAVLWNRLEPQMHEYYGGTGLGRMTFMLPSVRAIVALDPQLVQAYYVAPVILIDSGHLQTGMDLAKEGVQQNPRSGLLLASYAELLFTRSKDATAALPYAVRTLAADTVWTTDEERWDAMAGMRAVFDKNGMPGLAAQAKAIMDAIDANPDATMVPVEPSE